MRNVKWTVLLPWAVAVFSGMAFMATAPSLLSVSIGLFVMFPSLCVAIAGCVGR